MLTVPVRGIGGSLARGRCDESRLAPPGTRRPPRPRTAGRRPGARPAVSGKRKRLARRAGPRSCTASRLPTGASVGALPSLPSPRPATGAAAGPAVVAGDGSADEGAISSGIDSDLARSPAAGLDEPGGDREARMAGATVGSRGAGGGPVAGSPLPGWPGVDSRGGSSPGVPAAVTAADAASELAPVRRIGLGTRSVVATELAGGDGDSVFAFFASFAPAASVRRLVPSPPLNPKSEPSTFPAPDCAVAPGSGDDCPDEVPGREGFSFPWAEEPRSAEPRADAR